MHQLSEILLEKQIDEEKLCELVPELETLKNCMQPPHHSLDVYQHTLIVVKSVDRIIRLKLAALLHDIAKPLVKTGDDTVAHFYGHEDRGSELSKVILERLHYDHEIIDDVAKIVKYHMHYNRYTETWSDRAVMKLYNKTQETMHWNILLAIADCGSDKVETHVEAVRRLTGFKDRVKFIKRERGRFHAQKDNLSPLNGHEILAIAEDRKEGSWIGQLLHILSNAVRNNEFDQNDKIAAEKVVRYWLEIH